MSREEYPTHDILPIPEGLDEATLVFVLEHLASVAMDFELSPLQSKLDLANPKSIDDFIMQLEEQIRLSERTQVEKEAALRTVTGLINFYRTALEQTRKP